MASEICYEKCNDFKFGEVIKWTSLPFLKDFMNHLTTKIGGANYAGFCSDSHQRYVNYTIINQVTMLTMIILKWYLVYY